MATYENKTITTNLPQLPIENNMYAWCGYFTAFIAMISIVGNGLVITANCLTKSLRKPVGNLLVLNMAVIDLLSGILMAIPLCFFLLAYSSFQAKGACINYAFFGYIFITAENLTLTLISYDRSVAVTRSLQYHNVMTRKKVRILITMAWIPGTLIAILPLTKTMFVFDHIGLACKFEWVASSVGYTVFVTGFSVLCFGIPSLAMLGFYIKILLALKKLQTVDFVVQDGTSSVVGFHCIPRISQSTICSASTKRSLKTLYILMGVYFVTFTPFITIQFVVHVFNNLTVPPWLYLLVILLKLSSSACNPFIYALLRKEYRDAFIKIWADVRRKFEGLRFLKCC